MRLLDTSRASFTVTKAVEEKTDQNDAQKGDRTTKQPLWVVQVLALDETGGEMLTVSVAGIPTKVKWMRPSPSPSGRPSRGPPRAGAARRSAFP
jgi:hypothetical protein